MSVLIPNSVLFGLLGPPTKFTTLSPKNAAESIW